MLKRGLKNHKKPAQHIVEFALMMPVFIVLFSWIFQIMVETYSKYRFSYIFSTAVINRVNSQPVYSDMENDDRKNYQLSSDIEETLKNNLMTKSSTPYSDINVKDLPMERVVFLMGVFNFTNTLLFIGKSGAYFYFTLPIGSAYAYPPVLNEAEADITDYFDSYYDIYSSKMCADLMGVSECTDSTFGGS